MKIIFRRSDGGISITHVSPKDNYEDIKRKHVPSDAVILHEGECEIPEDRTDRDCWDFEGGKVKVNAAKKAAKEAEKSKKSALKAKLKSQGFTDEEIGLMVK